MGDPFVGHGFYMAVTSVLSLSAVLLSSTLALNPGPATPAAQPTQEAEPQLQQSGGPITVHNPAYGVQVDGARTHSYDYKPRRWKDVIRSSPELLALHRRGRLMIPGIVLTCVGSSWLAISTAASIDHGAPRSALGNLMVWIAPAALITAGVPMLVIGSKARKQLHAQRVQLMASPMVSAGQAGAVVMGRF